MLYFPSHKSVAVEQLGVLLQAQHLAGRRVTGLKGDGKFIKQTLLNSTNIVRSMLPWGRQER